MTSSTLEGVCPYDVLIAKVRFEDKPEVVKPRPVVAVTIDDALLTVLAVKVTSHAPRAWCPGEVVLEDWQTAGLLKPSVARCSKLMMLEERDIKARVGTLSPRDQAAVMRGILTITGTA